MRTPFTSVLLCLLIMVTVAVVPASAQKCVATPNAAGVAFGRSTMTFTQSDFNAVDANKVPIITDFFASIALSGKEVTNFTVPKASVTPVPAGSGVPANCYETLLPAMAGLLTTNTYVLTLTTRGPAGGTVGANTASFFLLSAPQAAGSISFATPTVP